MSARGAVRRLALAAALILPLAAVDCSGASTLHVGATKSLTGNANGASTVTYAGETDVAVSTSGASSVKARD